MIRLPHGGIAAGGLQSRWGYEDLASELMCSYLAPVRREYLARTAGRIIGRAAVPTFAELVQAAAVEHTEALFERASVEALFLGVAGG